MCTVPLITTILHYMQYISMLSGSGLSTLSFSDSSPDMSDKAKTLM